MFLFNVIKVFCFRHLGLHGFRVCDRPPPKATTTVQTTNNKQQSPNKQQTNNKQTANQTITNIKQQTTNN